MKKLYLIKETCWTYPGFWAVSYAVRDAMWSELPPYMRSATVIAESYSYEDLMKELV